MELATGIVPWRIPALGDLLPGPMTPASKTKSYSEKIKYARIHCVPA